MGHGDRPGRRDHPPNVLGLPVPKLHAKAHVRYVMEVRIFQLAQQLVDAAIKVRVGTLDGAGFCAQSFKQAKRIQLAVLIRRVLTHKEQKENIRAKVKART